jgi:hypothetical protein
MGRYLTILALSPVLAVCALFVCCFAGAALCVGLPLAALTGKLKASLL